MKQGPAPRLDNFEASLLAQLRAVVGETSASAPGRAALPGRHTGSSRRRWYGAAAATAAAALVVALVWQNVWPTPAFAVSGRNGGEISVRVMRLEGAEGLESALGERGIPADITYLPESKECAPGRYTAVRTTGLTLGVSAEEFMVTIPPGAVGAGDTFVLSAAVVPLQNGVRASVHFDVAHGAVAPCRMVDAR